MASPIDLFRRLTNGVYVIGAFHNGRANAFTAAWLTQVSFDPLLVALTVNPENFSYALIQQSGVFAVSILRQGQLELARHFGTQSGREVDKLAGHRWRPRTLGAPVLLDAAAYLECRVVKTTTAGDHKLVLGRVTGGQLLAPGAPQLGRVTGGQLLAPGAPPLLYADTDDIDGSSALYPESF